MCENCGSKIACFFLFTINIVFFVAGAGLLGIGIWVRVDPRTVEFAKILAPSRGAGDPLLQSAAILLIVLGAVVFIIGFLGCCGAMKKNQCMLKTYGALVIILAIAQIAAGILAVVFIRRVDTTLNDAMNEGLDKYSQIEGLRTAWDSMQVWVSCCGRDNATDWNRNNRVCTDVRNNCTTGPIAPGNWSAVYPSSCCKLRNKDPGKLNERGTYEDVDGCSIERQGTYNDNGCYTTVKDWLRRNSVIVIGIAFGFVAIQFFIAIVAICLAKSDYMD